MCTHTRKTRGYYVDNPAYSGPGDDWESPYIYIDGSEESTTVDIDTHRYKCTQCGEVMYYSSAARRYYEDGKSSHALGLGV